MGFLDKLWDETLAGPAPESGLAKLRKYNSLSVVQSPNRLFVDSRGNIVDDHTARVSRSITVLRTRSIGPIGSDIASSHTLSSEPSTPVSAAPGTRRDSDVKRFTRKKHTMEQD